MKRIYFFRIFLICFIYSISANLDAQVTIGSLDPPVAGVLLDLKTESDGSSTKGLGMPRLALTQKNDLSDILSGTITDEMRLQHVGLTVYNLSENTSFCKGMYVWSGTEWTPVGFTTTGTIMDADGNTYTTRLMACKYWWMTQEMRTTTDASGGDIGTVVVNPAIRVYDVPRTIYIDDPIGARSISDISYIDNGSPVTLTFTDFAKIFGYLYNFEQAQKICPTGWGLPTPTDWANLLISLNAMIPGNNSSALIKSDNHTYSALTGGANINRWGGYEDARNPGFNAYPSGRVTETDFESVSFGDYSLWWNQRSGTVASPIYSSMQLPATGPLSETRFLLDTDPQTNYLSVRCVKK